MNKQIIRIILAFVFSCSIAYLIGQKVVLPLTDKELAENQQEIAGLKEQEDIKRNSLQGEEDSNAKAYDLIEEFSNLTLIGQNAVDDNPWGSNLTVFEDEERGTCLLMTPGTEVSARYLVQEEDALCWNCGIHPLMAEISDGAELTITVCGIDQDEIRIIESFQITAADTYEQDSISLTEFVGTEVQLTLSVGNGNNDDSSGDWLIFDQLMIVSQ